MNIELVSHPLCPFVQRSVILLLEKGLRFEFRPIDLENKPEWFLALSPRGKVPVLVVQPDGAGEKTAVFESDVINEYLDEANPPRLLPDDPLARARLRGFVEVANDLFATTIDIAYGQTEEKFGKGQEAARRILARVEHELAGHYFAGDSFGLVDVAFAPVLHRFEFLRSKTAVHIVPETPKLQAWAKRILARPTVQGSVVPDFAERYVQGLRKRGAWVASRFV